MTFQCQSCSFRCPAWRVYLRHSFEAHSCDPNFSFTCGVDGCPMTFKTYSSIRAHLSKKHPNSPDPAPAPVIEEEGDSPMDTSTCDVSLLHTEFCNVEQPHTAQLQTVSANRHAGLLLLTLKEKHRLTQTSVDFAVHQIQSMIKYTLEDAKESIEQKLQLHFTQLGVQLPDISDCFANIDPFSGLESEYMQTKFYKENFNLVEPVTVALGVKRKYVGLGSNRRLTEVEDTFQYVPLLPGLQSLLRNSDIRHEVFLPHARNDGFLSDYCDGTLYKSHELYCHSPHALQLIMYFDELEVCNPLGAQKGVHKLGVFYYMIGNIRPELRATQRAIQLIACVKSTHIKEYGFQPILNPFIDDVKTLAEEGISIGDRESSTVLRGTVLLTLADTLAAHQLGGFKVGVGFALRKCRECMATQNDLQCKFREDQFQLRDPASYDCHCLRLEGSLADSDSVTYGINYRSPLNDIPFFHVANSQLPQDIMHVILEGVLSMETKLMLNVFINEKKYFTIDFLNGRMLSFSYGKTEARNKPPRPLMADDIRSQGYNLPFSAAQMWNFAMYLPFFIADKVPEEEFHWECFLLLLEILRYCTAKVTCEPSTMYLVTLIDDHHRSFRQCYPSVSLTPKFHYMVHLPRLMLRLGPLVNTWCMRMEGKNSYFKQVARIGNFKNIAYSVARRHQRLLCAHLQGKFFTYDDLQCGPCSASQIRPLQDDLKKDNILAVLPQTSPATPVTRPKWIRIFGQEYHLSCMVQVGWQPDDLPIFAKVINIIVVVGIALLEVKLFFTEGINSHLSSYLITTTPDEKMLILSTLENKEVHYAHTFLGDRKLYVCMRSNTERINNC